MIKLIVLLPLLAAIVTGLNTRNFSVKVAQFITTLCVGTAAVLSYVVFFDVVNHPENAVDVSITGWMTSGLFTIDWVLRVDSLTAIMLVLVNTVSALVHLYSIGYMSHDKHPQRFMCYLSLFTFFMLMLVTSNNFVQLYLGWEGVGLCSYLLIGFWFKKDSANKAAMKAFIVNRVGDFGFALGIFAIFATFNSVMFDDVFAAVESVDKDVMTIICLLLFIGAMGKSAQLGLHTWLPDAMEGPTPVSALIHAATMVTAGVFMVARCSPMFAMSEVALHVVTVVGAATCLFAATVAITQNDIKRVIAYSTCSQLGYMFFACGVTAYSAGVFHLFTHGFFKALLFLGAGSVIHAMSDEQDMRKMGGLWKKIPLTFAMMMIGTLAITGVPFLSGYYSKDMVLEAAYASGDHTHGFNYGHMAYWVGIAAATLTAFYSWRLIFMTFFGKMRNTKEVEDHVHESPKVMTIPLIVLSIGAIGAGYLMSNYGIVSGDLETYSTFWGNALVMPVDEAAHVVAHAHHVPTYIKLMPICVGVFGLVLAFFLYWLKPDIPAKIAKTFNPVYKFLLNKWYFDELYEWLFVKPTKAFGRFLWTIIDIKIIDGLGPNGMAFLSRKTASGFSKVQSGLVYHYAFAVIIGMVILVSLVLFSTIS